MTPWSANEPQWPRSLHDAASLVVAPLCAPRLGPAPSVFLLPSRINLMRTKQLRTIWRGVATASAKKKSSGLDMRMTDEQREETELAASVKGMSLTQWALQNLLSVARRNLEEETATRLSARTFMAFRDALDRGMPPEAQVLFDEKPVWEWQGSPRPRRCSACWEG